MSKSKSLIEAIKLNEVSKAQADYMKWSTLLYYRDKIMEDIQKLKDKIDSGEIKDTKAISKELQTIMNRNYT